MAKVVGRAPARVMRGAVLLFVLGGLCCAVVLQGTVTEARQLQLHLRTERAALLQQRFDLEVERAQTVSPVEQAQRALLTERAARLELEKILVNVQVITRIFASSRLICFSSRRRCNIFSLYTGSLLYFKD